jgi:putative flippase GtrA
MSEPDAAVGRAGPIDCFRSSSGRLDRERANLEIRHAVKYEIVGVTNVTLDFALYALLVSVGLWYPLAKTASLIVATANGYTLNRIWTFRAGRHRNIVLTKYVTVQASCLAGNIALLVLLIEVGGLHKVTAQAIALPFIALGSFTGQRLWTFGHVMRPYQRPPDGRPVVQNEDAHQRHVVTETTDELALRDESGE